MPLNPVSQPVGWPAVKRIVSVAVLAGLTAGLCLTAVQQWQVSPLIHQAEVYENAASHAHDAMTPVPAVPAADPVTQVVHTHSHTHAHSVASAFDNHAPVVRTSAAVEEAAWQPADGSERLLYTILANVSMAVGFGLLLAAALYLHGGATTVRTGLLWGAAGYLVFFVAPSLGLLPELPGTQAAPLIARQLWWFGTVVAATTGLALLSFARLPLKLVGIVVLALPYMVGAPQPEIAGGSAPVALAQAFVLATALANGVLWLVLGMSVGHFYRTSAA